MLDVTALESHSGRLYNKYVTTNEYECHQSNPWTRKKHWNWKVKLVGVRNFAFAWPIMTKFHFVKILILSFSKLCFVGRLLAGLVPARSFTTNPAQWCYFVTMEHFTFLSWPLEGDIICTFKLLMLVSSDYWACTKVNQ